jgi:N-acyl-D-amino-acid deacylase
MYDVVFKGGQVCDGLGNPLVEADLAVEYGRIAAIGRIAEPARETVDARGRVVAPGFIDIHTHYDAQLTWEQTASPSTSLGVTTVVMGNCGFGIAPAPARHRDFMMRNLAEVEGMSLESLRAGIKWEFESFPDYVAYLRRRGIYPNAAIFASHTSIRTKVMGEDSMKREATPDEIEAMRKLVAEAVDGGAIGFATSTHKNHHGVGGLPMPSRLATEEEFVALGGILGERGRGLFMINGGDAVEIPFLERIAARIGRPAVWAPLLHNENTPEWSFQVLSDCAAARARGNEVYAQVSCLPFSMDFNLKHAFPFYGVGPWPMDQIEDTAALARTIGDPSFRKAIREALEVPSGIRIFNGNWNVVEIAWTKKAENKRLEGRDVAAIARERGVDPLDLLLDLALEENLETTFNALMLNSDEAAVERILQHEASLVALSDAGAHLTFMCDAGYALHMLGHWVREKRRFTLEDAVRRLTSRQADAYRIPERGRLLVGAPADIVVFDPTTVGVSRNRRVDDLPAGGTRMVRDAIGLDGVWVNGTQIFSPAGYADLKKGPGEVLTRFNA